MEVRKRKEGKEGGWHHATGLTALLPSVSAASSWYMKEKIGVLLLSVLLVACPPPGKGPKARANYQEAQPLIDALELYHQKTQQYPDSAQQLVPDYLPSVSNPFDYKKTEEGYSIHFSYTGPGMNHCTYQPKTKWQCSGYF
jgi:hypothetical protein